MLSLLLFSCNRSIHHHHVRCLAHSSHGSSGSNAIMIFASEVPVIAKLNPYRKIEDVFYTVWRRTNEEQVRSLEEKLLLPTPEEKINNIIAESGVSKVREHALETSAKVDSIEDLDKVLKGVTSDIEQIQDVKDEIKKDLIKHVTSEVAQTYGKQNESKAISHYEDKHKVKVVNSNTKFYKKHIGMTSQNKDIWVGGRIDGEVGKRIIEIKNRKKRFMNPLPKYDVAQLQTYLHILESPEGELVEHLRSKTSGGGLQTHTTVIPRDDSMWQTDILPHVMNFADGLNAFMDDRRLRSYSYRRMRRLKQK